MNKPFIYLASPDEAFISAHKEALITDFDLNVFRSGEECKTALSRMQPTVLILDTRLPDVDAYQLHRDIRDDFDTSDVYQILLCTEEQAADDNFVANDFLIMPCAPGVFRRKIGLLKQSLDEKQRTREQMAYAQNVAMTAMSSMGELGVVMEFMSKSFACRTIQAVSELALNAIKQYDLDSIIHFTWEGESYMARTDGAEISPTDREHIAQLRTLGRILEINQQLIVNYEHTSILIRKMPEDTDRCGRLRDNIATLCEGVESRVTGLLLEHDNRLKQQGIRYAVCEIRDSVANLYERQIAYVNAGRDLIGKVTNDFEDAFMHMGMVPEVENELIAQLVTLRQRISDIWSEPSEVENKLRTVVMSLETLAGDVTAEEVFPTTSA